MNRCIGCQRSLFYHERIRHPQAFCRQCAEARGLTRLCDLPLTSKQVDKLARGRNPRSVLPVPLPGERCPRCHSPVNGMRSRPCLLCNPEAVPPEFHP